MSLRIDGEGLTVLEDKDPESEDATDNPDQDRYLRSLDRDYAEEAYWEDYCGGCDRSPCPENGHCTDWPDQNSDLRFLRGGLK
jgi:hypothetical protein